MPNQAAFLDGKGKPFVVRDDDTPTPEAHEVVLHNHAVAINPLDWKQQKLGLYVDNYPIVLGTDIAGHIFAVGKDVTAFKPGDRVIAHADGLLTKNNENSSFRLYSKTTAALVAKLPDNISFTDGSVLPLALSTAADGLFNKNHLHLPYPVATGAKKNGQTLLIWGGSGSVGSMAIQLAVAAGFDVATTASTRNTEYVKSLGAKFVFDHSEAGVVDKIVAALQGQTFAGAFDTISHEDTARKTAEVIHRLPGMKFMATTLPEPNGLPADVKSACVFGVSIANNEVSTKIWGEFAADALASGALKPKPEALVVGKGLDKIQTACEMSEAGVSAKKLVVELV